MLGCRFRFLWFQPMTGEKFIILVHCFVFMDSPLSGVFPVPVDWFARMYPLNAGQTTAELPCNCNPATPPPPSSYCSHDGQLETWLKHSFVRRCPRISGRVFFWLLCFASPDLILCDGFATPKNFRYFILAALIGWRALGADQRQGGGAAGGCGCFICVTCTSRLIARDVLT